MDGTKSIGFKEAVNRFFFADETPYGLAVIRILLPLVLLCVVMPRWSHSRELFSTDGAAAPLAENYGLMHFPWEPSGAIAVAMMSALVFSLISVSVGWHTRLMLLVSWFLYTYLNMLDCMSTLTKYSVISSHVLLLLCLSNCGAVWSVDHWRSQVGTTRRLPLDSAWPRRLIQLLIGLIYFGAAFTKMHTDGFMTGDQIRFWLITNMNNANPLGERLALYPALIVTMSHVAVIWQILFIFLSWKGRARMMMLGIGLMFHLSTVWILGLYIFPPVMIVIYFAWMNADDVRVLRNWILRLSSRLNRMAIRRITQPLTGLQRRFATLVPVPSALLLSISLSASVLAGLELEHYVDPYKERQIGGPLKLQPLDPDVANRMLHSNEGIRESDKFFSLELGRETLGGTVVGRDTSFAPGERVIVQCALVPPHEDMWIACSLMDSNGTAVLRDAFPISSEMLRANFVFNLPDRLDAGPYQFVVYSGDVQVLARRFDVAH